MIVKRKRAKLANELLDALERAKAELEIAKKLYSQVLCECGETGSDGHERGAQVRAAFLASRRRYVSALKALGRATTKKGQAPEQSSEESRQYAARSFLQRRDASVERHLDQPMSRDRGFACDSAAGWLS
jgi:hypothetical protein